MILRAKQAAFCILSTAGLLLAGCGTGTANQSLQACSANISADSVGPGADFKIAAVSHNLDIYPGGTATVQVAVQSNGSTPAGTTVTIGGSNLPHGVTITPVTATVGSTANVTITAANDVITSCFTGTYGVWTAGQGIALTGTDGSGNATTDVALNVTLENPSFLPTVSDGLPVMNITTVDGAAIDSKDVYTDATLSIVDAAKTSYNYTGTMGVKGHGNSTWGMPKKPYRLNLDSKASLLGMTSDTNWIMLANYDDKAMIRNDVSFNMSTEFGMFWTPNSAFVDLYLNGQYQGVYQLTEEVQVSKERLNIGSMDDTDNSGTDLTGGYLGEIDHYLGATFCYTAIDGNPLCLDDPDPPTATQATYFQTAEYGAEGALFGPNFTDPNVGWSAYWDQDSLINWFMVEEITGNEDSADFSSDYFYKPRGDFRFYMGPVWDMDITFGNFNYSSMNVNQPWVASYAAWYKQLFKDPAFLAAVKARWLVIRPQVVALSSYITTRQGDLTQAAANNYGRWPILGEKVWPNPVASGTYPAEVANMQAWLTARIAYMDATYGP